MSLADRTWRGPIRNPRLTGPEDKSGTEGWPSMNLRRQRALMVSGTMVLVVWGSVGLYEGLHSGFSGGLYDPEYRVPDIRRGGPADRAGFRAGDQVISVEGRPVEDLGMESRWPRALVPRLGESRRFVVERSGQRIPIDMVFPRPSRDATNNRIRAALIGLAFLAVGLWTFLTVRTGPARTLAQIGLAGGVGAALALGPHLGWWNGVQGHIATAAQVLMFILMLRFFVTFPARKGLSGSRLAASLVYGAWACLLVFLLGEVIVHPALYYSTGGVTSLLTLAYAVLILASVTHTFVRGPRALLRRSGMYWIVGGFLIAFAGTASGLARAVNLPAWSDALWVAAIPVSMALAVRREAKLEPAREKTSACV